MKSGNTYLVVASILFSLLGVLGVPPALFAPMILGAPGAISNPAAQLLFWSVFTFPVVCGVAVITASVLAGNDENAAALKWIHLPLVNIAGAFVAWSWLEIAFGGKLNG